MNAIANIFQLPQSLAPPMAENVVPSARLQDSGMASMVRSKLVNVTLAKRMTDSLDRERPAFSSRPELPLPTEPPFTAHIGNLSFDATSSDISELFADCEVTNVRIVEDKLNRSPKGFGYVEFASVEGLKKALTFSGTTLQGRAIRVSIAEPRMYLCKISY